MKYLARLLTATSLLGFVSLGLVRAEDVVSFMGKSPKAETAKGTIEKEGPGGIRIKEKSGERDIPALNIVGVVYDQKTVPALAFRAPFSKLETLSTGKAEDRKKQLPELLKDLQGLEGKFGDNPKMLRHVQYCICQVHLLQVRDDGAARGEPAKEAIAQLVKFKDKPANVTGWQIVPALKALAQLQEAKDDMDGALASYQQLAELPEVPPEIKLTSELLIGQMLMRRGKHADAEKKYDALVKGLKADDPLRPLCQVALLQARLEQGKLDGVEADLRKALTANDDPNLKAAAHNALGDYFRKKDNLEEAFWHYLRVDVLYPQDVTEHAKALYYLSKLFDKPKNDPLRAQQCRDKLKEDVYKGTEYQKKADAEK